MTVQRSVDVEANFVEAGRLALRLRRLLGPNAPGAVKLRRGLEDSAVWRTWRRDLPHRDSQPTHSRLSSTGSLLPSTRIANVRATTWTAVGAHTGVAAGVARGGAPGVGWWVLDAQGGKSTEREPVRWEVFDALVWSGVQYGGVNTRLVLRAVDGEIGWSRPTEAELVELVCGPALYPRIAALAFGALLGSAPSSRRAGESAMRTQGAPLDNASVVCRLLQRCTPDRAPGLPGVRAPQRSGPLVRIPAWLPNWLLATAACLEDVPCGTRRPATARGVRHGGGTRPASAVTTPPTAKPAESVGTADGGPGTEGGPARHGGADLPGADWHRKRPSAWST